MRPVVVLRFIALILASVLAMPSFAVDAAKAARFYEDGLARFNKDDFPGAVIQLKNALQVDRNMLAAHLLLAKAFLRTGDLGLAEVELLESIKLGVSPVEVMVPLGRLYLTGGRPQNVIARVRADGLSGREAMEVTTIRGIAEAQIGDFAAAGRSFEAARGLMPTSATPLIAEVPALIGQGNLKLAEERARRAIELEPALGDAWNMLASVLHARMDLSAALDAYDKALELSPENVDARVARAGLLLDLARDEDALTDVNAVANYATGEPRSAYLRSVIASRRGDRAGELKSLGEVARLVDSVPPDWLVGREQMLMLGALAHYGLRESEAAKGYLDTLVSRYGRNTGARKLLARLYLDEDDAARALSTVEPVLRDSPRDEQALILAGEANLKLRRLARANELFEKAVRQGGERSPAFPLLGMAQLRGGQTDAGASTLARSFANQPGDLSVGMTLASIYLKQGDRARAVATARRFSSAYPTNPIALTMLGAVLAAAGDVKAAYTAYEGALAADPAFTPAALNLARIDGEEGRPEAARARLAVVLRSKSDQPDALYELGRIERRMGNLEKAEELFAKAEAKSRRDPRASIARIELYLESARFAEALEAASSLAAANTGNTQVLDVLGRAQLASQDTKSARQTFKEMTRLVGEDAEAQTRIAGYLIDAGFPDEAEYAAGKALAIEADNVQARLVMGRVKLSRGDLPAANSLAAELRRAHPNDPAGYLLAGDASITGGRAGDAVDHYRKAFALEPGASNLLALARGLMAAGDVRGAAQRLDKWLHEHPRDLGVLRPAAEVAVRAGNRETARRYLEQIVALLPGDWSSLNNLAMLLHELKDPKAEAVARRAHALASSEASVTDTLGLILMRAGKLDDGLRYLRDARLRAPRNAAVRLHLVEALVAAGRLDEARGELEEATKAGLGVQDTEAGRLLAQRVARK